MASAEEEEKHGQRKRPSMPVSLGSAAGKMMGVNGHFAKADGDDGNDGFDHGIQVVDADGVFNDGVSDYLRYEKLIPAGFNYHLISVFGSQSTGKSTLLNHLFGTTFGVMSEEERKQTTKGIWMSKNKRQNPAGSAGEGMADNILVMDVEGTDGRERGEDQDFERKSALFALATSEVLIINLWEHQVGLYQGANMGLLKTVFEVNLQLFIKDSRSIPRSLLFFVIRDHLGTTPLSNLQTTLLSDLSRLWASISKPPGLESSKIQDYFDFAFVALSHKILKTEEFESEVTKLSTRFREGYKDSKKAGLIDASQQPLLLPEYHRRIPADGFPIYARGVWEQIVNNKDLDLPTQQELLAQFRCDEIAREGMITFDQVITPLETRQAEAARTGRPLVISELGQSMTAARVTLLKGFETAASRYHKVVYTRRKAELESSVDARLKALFQAQLDAAHKSGISAFADAVGEAVKSGQKRDMQYDFADIVATEKKKACARFEDTAKKAGVQRAPWSAYSAQFDLFKKEIDESSKRLRQDEIRRLANRVERWVRTRLGEATDLEFRRLSYGRGVSGPVEKDSKPPPVKELWDRIWDSFTQIMADAEERFTRSAKSFDASPDEVEIGLWRLRRKGWAVLKTKIEETCADGNLATLLREHFEDLFRYDDQGVPRIWRPSDDIDGLFAKARDETLTLIPLASRFRLSHTSASPPLDAWVGATPSSVSQADEEGLVPIGGVDEDEGRSLEDEMLILSETRRTDISAKFRKMADGVYVEAKRGALGGVTQTPWWMWGLLLVLGQNEIMAVARNPLLIILVLLSLGGMYITYQLNLWGPIIRMSNAASQQAIQIAKEKLREFLESSDIGREAVAMAGRRRQGQAEDVKMDNLDNSGKKRSEEDEDLWN